MSGLPPIAARADDLEAIRKAVDDAAAVSGALWFSYLFALFYFAVAAGAVTHEDLFFERAVKLPFLNIELPLLAFFFAAPILFVAGHAYVLVHLVMLTDKAKRYDESLDNQIKENVDLSKDERARRRDIHAGLRQQLPSNIFVLFLAGPKKLRESSFGWLLRAIAWVTLVIAPVLLLLLMQVQFLPYHNGFITWTHRVVLFVDLGVIWWLWRKILSGREIDARDAMSSLVATEIGLILTFLVIAFTLTVATYPGEWQEDLLAKWDRPKWTATPHNWLFSGPVDDTTRRRTSLFSGTLVLTGLNIYEGLGIDDPDKAKWHDYIFRARGRDLRGAIFDLASLPKVDFEGANLQGAKFGFAQLEGASLDHARLDGAWLNKAKLQGASLQGAQLRGARPVLDQLQGASLASAQLQGAWLDGAQLQGASLASAQLQGASLKGAWLQGAALQGAALEATDLLDANLWRTDATPPQRSPSAIRLSDGDKSWIAVWRDERGQEQPWDGKAYQTLRSTIESLVPAGRLGDEALNHIESLDCASSDERVAPCESQPLAVPQRKPPPGSEAWRKALDAARVNDTDYAVALAKVLKGLVCSGDDDAIHVLRGAGFQGRLQAAAASASGLIDDLTNKDSKDCPVAASLTDADRAELLQIKQEAEKASK